jgi:iron complex outermembrane receptor protein
MQPFRSIVCEGFSAMKSIRRSGPLWTFVFAASVHAANPHDGDELVVTSTPLHENALEVAQPASVLAGDELRRRIAASLGETLSRELGISSAYFGPAAAQPVIRGLSGYRVQVLQDGAAALDVSTLSQDHAVSVESVVSRQIEIVKGPATLLYGSGAAGGLINVVTGRIPNKRALAPISGA